MFVVISSQKALLMCPYVSDGKFSALVPHCSHSLLRNLQPTSDRRLNFANHLADRMVPAMAIISRLLCLQGTRRSFKYFPKYALLSFCRNMKSAVHVPYAGYLIWCCFALARTHDFKNTLSSIQVFCCKTLTMLGYDASYRCLCVQSSMSSPLHHLSYRRLSVLICLRALFMFLHLILCCPSSYCISHDIIKCRMTILISYVSFLTSRFFPREDFSIRPLTPFFAYLRI